MHVASITYVVIDRNVNCLHFAGMGTLFLVIGSQSEVSWKKWTNKNTKIISQEKISSRIYFFEVQASKFMSAFFWWLNVNLSNVLF